MPKFPERPEDLVSIASADKVLAAGTELWHVYFQAGAHPRAWYDFRAYGPVPSARFDYHLSPPHVQDRAIFHAGSLATLCIAEVFQQERVIDRKRDSPWLVGFTLTRDVVVLDLCGTWPTRAGASMAINSGQRSRAQRWSAAIYAAYPYIEGLWYPSSMYGNQPAAAFYERAGDAVKGVPIFHMPLTARGITRALYSLAQEIGYDIW
jgi:hypothetical protein